MIYNAKIIKYKNTGEQDVRLYSNPVQTKDKDMERDKIKPKEKKPKEEKELTTAELWANKERSIKTSQNRTINKIYEIARANNWEYFVTFTFNGEKVDRYNYKEVVKKLSNWLDNAKRRKAKDMMYIIVPELHKDGAYHFHGLLKGIGAIKLIDSQKRDNKGRIIYNLGDYGWGWTTVTEVTDTAKASNYITKYITKELIVVTEGKKRYWASKNVDKPITEHEFIDRDTMELLRTQYDIKGQKKVIVDVNNYHQEIEYFTIL